jgi:hypothetical protein
VKEAHLADVRKRWRELDARFGGEPSPAQRPQQAA